MVKSLDDMDVANAPTTEPVDHVGIALWRAAQAWRGIFGAEMARRGYPWHREARGEVLAHLGPAGRSQSSLTASMGMSKQATQQLIDQLEAEGVVFRTSDPTDRRARRVELTDLGLADHAERGKVKQLIEDNFRQQMGELHFTAMMEALQVIAADDGKW